MLFLLIGTMGGDNGKTTFLEICREALGEYAGEIQIETLMAKPKEAMMGNNINAPADLRGCRFVTSSEVEQGERFNVSRVKNLTKAGTRFALGICDNASSTSNLATRSSWTATTSR